MGITATLLIAFAAARVDDLDTTKCPTLASVDEGPRGGKKGRVVSRICCIKEREAKDTCTEKFGVTAVEKKCKALTNDCATAEGKQLVECVRIAKKDSGLKCLMAGFASTLTLGAATVMVATLLM